MKRQAIALVSAALLAGPALAQDATGDAKKGERVFKRCQACHVVEAPDGTILAGRSGKIGPNLYDLEGRAAASVEDFRYGTSIKKAAEMGLVWNEENFVGYVQDPTGFLREYTGDNSARAKMSFKLRKEDDAKDVYAYITSLTQ